MEKNISRRDFLKLASLGVPAAFLTRLDVESLLTPEKGVQSEEWFYPSSVTMLLIPIRKDWSWDDTGPEQRLPIEIKLDGKVALQARNIQDLRMNGAPIKVAEIPFVGGIFTAEPNISANADQFMGIAILELNGKRYYEEADKEGGEILGGFTGILGESLTAIKVENILEAANSLLKYQEENDGFRNGDHSFLKIQRASNFRIKDGIAPGAGVVAALLSKSLFSLVEKGKAEYVERNLHATDMQYFDGPTAPELNKENSDATVDIDDARLGRRDFSWRFKGMGKTYLWIDIAKVPNGSTSGARLVLTMTWRDAPPPVGTIERFGSIEKTVSWEYVKTLASITHPEFTTKNFGKEIKGPDFKLVYYLMEAVSEYSRTYSYTIEDEKAGRPKPLVKLGTFLAEKAKKDGVNLPKEAGLGDLDDNTYLKPGQALQCLGWVSFLGTLNLSFSPVYVGGRRTATASGLLSDQGREALKYSKIFADDELLFYRLDDISEARIGDSFVRYGGNNKNHIGTVIGKKKVWGETILLLTDANRKEDGAIRVFEVNKDNFRVIFGEGKSTPPVVIREK